MAEAVVAATSVEWVECHEVASLVVARAARAGAALITIAAIGMATTGTVTTGIMGIITAMM